MTNCAMSAITADQVVTADFLNFRSFDPNACCHALGVEIDCHDLGHSFNDDAAPLNVRLEKPFGFVLWQCQRERIRRIEPIETNTCDPLIILEAARCRACASRTEDIDGANWPACGEKIVYDLHQGKDLNRAGKNGNGARRYWPILLLLDKTALDSMARKF